MKKFSRIISVIAVLVLVLCTAAPSFAATSEPSNDTIITNGDVVPADWETFQDFSTGLTLEYPPSWNVYVHNTTIDANNTEGLTKKVIELQSITGEYTVKFTELNSTKNFQIRSFIINDNGENNYYVSANQTLTLIDGDAAYIYNSESSRRNMDLQNAWLILQNISFR